MIPRRLAAVVLAAILLAGCAVTAEQTLVGDFFAASRLRDLTALSRIGTVVFEPRQRGIVTTFTVRRVSPARVEQETPVKDVTIDATVRLPDGRTVTTTLLVRMQRLVHPPDPDAAAFYQGWRVTAVTEGQ
jgi:hypothetical protein